MVICNPKFRKDGSGQPVQTQIILLIEEQSDQGPHCLIFHMHHLNVSIIMVERHRLNLIVIQQNNV